MSSHTMPSTATISSAGLLTASSVSSDEPITVSASYSEGGVTKTMGRQGGGGKAMRVLVALALLLARADAACRGLQGEFVVLLPGSSDNDTVMIGGVVL